MAWRRLTHWLEPLVFLGSNRITLAGAILTTSSALTMVGFWLLEVLQLRTVHPYGGIILYLILPGIFVLGLVLMPVGVFLRRRRLRARGRIAHMARNPSRATSGPAQAGSAVRSGADPVWPMGRAL